MPYFPQGKKGSTASPKQDYEMFKDFSLLAHHYNFSHWDILKLPHSAFLSYKKHAYIHKLEQTEEGREYLNKAYRYMNPRVDADLSSIRRLTGYSSVEKGGNN